ncbi:SpoIIE family protein phosphatase [Streptomyces sp. NBC_00503]|uniref:SpoIIE family protein phosphatase n=1 Tax=Streptomyces sp. NBC_00503 TaxID=2903659 RepID=UPI002E808C12|nr:SpoIIE family protein phosphatase [Streptomyces sp. NBC_00503]WUD79214.1 SpoIIE family protein phosphatase [Streptomyces sp. NBC_00503]
MNRFARLATRVLAVPLGLVCLEPAGEAAGVLPECWPPETRPDPAVLECCRRVAEDGRPLFLSRAGDGTAAFSFAGVPLVGSSGELLGVLAVMDGDLRVWSEDEVQDLSDLAAACSAQARMRVRSEIGRQAREAAEDAAVAAEGETTRVHELLNRSELLLQASEDLADTRGLDDVRQRVGDLVSGDLKPARVDLLLVRQGMLHPVLSPVDGDVPHVSAPEQFALGSPWPVARAVRENRMVVVAGPQSAADTASDTVRGTMASPGFDALNLHTAACLPLRGTHGVLGALVLGWDTPHEIDLDERAVLTTLAGYTAQAVERALHLDDRVTAASQLQRAMLTDLPDAPGLELAALYRPAARDDMVGGDWYDAYPLPRVPGSGATGALALTVGDITGHDMRAAALMGQVRSMLRQADHDHPGEGPEQALGALERACRRLDLPASGTAVHAHIRPEAEGHWQLRWSNAGHPSPLLLTPDGAVESLTQHDVLLHHALPPRPRTCGSRSLPPGSTLLLYTDGLVEERGADIDENVERLTQELAAAPPGIRLHALLRSLLDTIGPREAQDDTVLFAVRVPAP